MKVTCSYPARLGKQPTFHDATNAMLAVFSGLRHDKMLGIFLCEPHGKYGFHD